jgi:hypothetical protein
VNGVSEHLFARATLAEQQDRNASQSGSLRAADGVSNHATLTGDVLKPRDVLRAFRRQMLQVAVGVSQEFRQDVNREIKGNVRDPRFARERLHELGRVDFANTDADPDVVYTPAVTLWAFLSQMLVMSVRKGASMSE